MENNSSLPREPGGESIREAMEFGTEQLGQGPLI